MTENDGTQSTSREPGTSFRLDGALVLPALNRIQRGHETFQVEPRVMMVLVCLARHPGEVLSRESLFREVWSDAVVCEEALTRTISELRRLFRDDPRSPRIIETIRKSGYRLVAPVMAAESTPRSEPAAEATSSSRPAAGIGAETTELPGRSPGGVTAPFLVADWLIEPELSRVSRNGDVVRLEPRVMQVLSHLAARPGEVFSRVALLRAVWSEEEIRETTLTSAISDLRRVFGDVPEEPRFIETIRGAGYRLVAPVRSPASGIAREGADAAPVTTPARRATRLGAALAATVLVAAAVLTAALLQEGRVLVSPTADWQVRPLTTYPGTEYTPALSPDGSMLAFSWQGEEPDERTFLDLYVMHVDRGTPVRLTSGVGHEIYPAWSPDGATIAYVCETPDSSELRTVKVLGGGHRTLLTAPSRIGGLDWSPDGTTIAYAAATDPGTLLRIHLLDLETHRRRPLDVPPLPGDHASPRFSPDGEAIAFVHVEDFNQQNILIAHLDSPEVEELTGVGRHVAGIEWTSDRELVFAASNLVDFDLWLADLDSGRRTWLTMPRRPAISPTVARGGARLVFGELSYECNIWSVDRFAGEQVRPREAPIAASTRLDYAPVCSPDSKSIAFLSDRSGQVEVWIADADGRDPWQLTNEVGSTLMSPRWAPDDGRVAYSALRDGRLVIHVSDVETRVARPLDGAAAHELLVHWSAAGDWLYYRVQHDDSFELWRRHGDGRGAERFSESGYTVLGETADADLFCWKDDAGGIWRLPATGGEPTLVVPGDVTRSWNGAAVAENGLYFIRRGVAASCLGYYEWGTARQDSLASVPLDSGLLVASPDGRRLYYDSTTSVEIDLVLADAGAR